MPLKQIVLEQCGLIWYRPQHLVPAEARDLKQQLFNHAIFSCAKSTALNAEINILSFRLIFI